jgi:hypothetical protein
VALCVHPQPGNSSGYGGLSSHHRPTRAALRAGAALAPPYDLSPQTPSPPCWYYGQVGDALLGNGVAVMMACDGVVVSLRWCFCDAHLDLDVGGMASSANPTSTWSTPLQHCELILSLPIVHSRMRCKIA